MNTLSLVTGGAGFIGSNLVDNLLEQGHSVICVDNESANNEKFYWNDKSWNVNADVTDYKAMKNIFTGVDYVFHLAAESRLQSAIQNPIQAVEKNCVGILTLHLRLQVRSSVRCIETCMDWRQLYSGTLMYLVIDPLQGVSMLL